MVMIQFIDARTGEKAWDHTIELSAPATNRQVFNLRSAPLVVGDKEIQGITASAGIVTSAVSILIVRYAVC